ncbi:MAG: TetR/AcrR family transcriptional regulator [Gammaproteobacteria bacterium]
MARAGGNTYHHGNLRAALVDAALPLLARHGAADLSLREVAKAAGVSNAAPYRHFPNRIALLEAIAAQGFARLIRVCSEAERRYPSDPKRQLVEAGMGYLGFAVEQPQSIQLMFGGVLDLRHCGDELKQAADAAILSLMHIIETGRKAGIYRRVKAMNLLVTAWSTIHGYTMLVSAGMLRDLAGSPQQVQALGKEISRTLLSGMLKR